MALWVVPDYATYYQTPIYVDYNNVDFGMLHTLITQIFGFGQYPKISVSNHAINSHDWDKVLEFGEAYSHNFLENYEALALSIFEKQFANKIVDLETSALLLHQQNYKKNKAPPPVCIPVLVKDTNLTNLREWLIYCRDKIDVQDQNPTFNLQIAPQKENGIIQFRSKGHLSDENLNLLFNIFGIRFKSEVMFSFMSKKSMNDVLGIKNQS